MKRIGLIILLVLCYLSFPLKSVYAVCGTLPTNSIPGWGATVSLDGCQLTVSGVKGIDWATAENSTSNSSVVELRGGTSITINSGATFAVGSISMIDGNIFIDQTEPFGQFKPNTPVYTPDTDNDGWADTAITSASFYTATNSGLYYRRLAFFRGFTSDCGSGAQSFDNTCGDGAISVSTSKNINSDTIAAGRSYADGIAYRVVAPADSATTLTRNSASDTLTNGIAAGDEILIINMQGTTTDKADVGNYETRIVSSITASTITLNTAITRSFDGTTASNQKVIAQRIPNYSTVTIANGGTLTAGDWVGLAASGAQQTGIVAFRASGAVEVQSGGTIHVNGKGYRGGSGKNSATVGADGGESYCGAGGIGSGTGVGGAGAAGGGGADVNATVTGGAGSCGGGGGGGSGTGSRAGGSGSASSGGAGAGGGARTGAGGGAGYGTAGGFGEGVNNGTAGGTDTSGGGGGGNSLDSGGGGGGGGTYFVGSLTDWYLGSGGGGGAGTGTNAGGAGGDGGGIIAIDASSITVTSTGTIEAKGSNGVAGAGSDGGGGSGGSILLAIDNGATVSTLVSVAGGADPGGAGSRDGGAGGSGRFVLAAKTISGSGYVDGYYQDADSDGFGNANVPYNGWATVHPPSGYIADRTDCNDGDNTTQGPRTCYLSADGDAYRTTATNTYCVGACSENSGLNNYTAESSATIDCNDSNYGVNNLCCWGTNSSSCNNLCDYVSGSSTSTNDYDCQNCGGADYCGNPCSGNNDKDCYNQNNQCSTNGTGTCKLRSSPVTVYSSCNFSGPSCLNKTGSSTCYRNVGTSCIWNW